MRSPTLAFFTLLFPDYRRASALKLLPTRGNSSWHESATETVTPSYIQASSNDLHSQQFYTSLDRPERLPERFRLNGLLRAQRPVREPNLQPPSLGSGPVQPGERVYGRRGLLARVRQHGSDGRPVSDWGALSESTWTHLRSGPRRRNWQGSWVKW